MFKARCVVVGVTGGIAAFKTASIVSSLKKAGADVHVIMTKNAAEFITPKTFETLSNNAVCLDTFERNGAFDVEHISLAKAADVFIVAPATANFLAKAANGIADDMLSTTFLAANCLKIVAPAMNTQMFNNEATKKNIEVLTERGIVIAKPNSGYLACGDTGDGRMAEPDEIISLAEEMYYSDKPLKNKKVLVTAGPTREFLDPVRFITSPSSGKMGYAIAERAAEMGAQVTLVSGPTTLKDPKNVEVIRIQSAAEMHEAAFRYYDETDIVFAAAAVADYTPASKSNEKIKKSGDMSISLVRTKDILKEMGAKKKGQFLVGFAAETTNVEEYAKKKFKEKNLDMIAANDVSKKGVGFAHDTNSLTVYFKDGQKDLGFASKTKLAELLIAEVIVALKER